MSITCRFYVLICCWPCIFRISIFTFFRWNVAVHSNLSAGWLLKLLLICFFSNMFYSYGDVTITGEGLQILTYTRHLWPFFSVPHVLWHGSPVYTIVISEDPRHSLLLPGAWQWNCHYLFYRLRCVATGVRTPISSMRVKQSTTEPRWQFSYWHETNRSLFIK